MESQHDIELTRKSGACAEAVATLESGMSYEQIYAWRPDWRAWRWANLRTITPRQAEALATVVPAEFWVRALGAAVSWSGANLYVANLYGANLRGANLRGSDLRGANLRGSDLRGANLRGSDLSGSDLHEAYRPENDIPGWTADANGYLHQPEE